MPRVGGQTEEQRLRWLAALAGVTEVPARGLVRVTGVDTQGVLAVDRPNTDAQFVYVAGKTPVSANGYGAVTIEGPVYALYDTADGAPVAGETWGAGAASFKLRKGKAGFIIEGDADATAGTVLVRRDAGSGGAAPTPLTVEYDDLTGAIINVNDLQAAIADFILSSPGAGKAKLRTRGYTGTLRWVCDWTCVSGLVTVKYQNTPAVDGLIGTPGACG